jgi:hypothetical protein
MFQQKYPIIRPVFLERINPDVFPKHLQGQLQTAQATVWGHGRARRRSSNPGFEELKLGIEATQNWKYPLVNLQTAIENGYL